MPFNFPALNTKSHDIKDVLRAENLKWHRNPVIHTISYLIFTLELTAWLI